MIQNKDISDFSINPGEIHIWLVKIGNPPQYYSELENLLSIEELTQARHFQFKKDQQSSIARRGILRLLLGKYCKASPKSITYQVTPFGKLSFPSCPHSFNISHSMDMAIFGFSAFPEIGVDIEQIQFKPDLVHMAERWFSPEELSGLSALPSQLQTEAFYHVWTQKEAYIKARGLGLSIPLKDFTVLIIIEKCEVEKRHKKILKLF